LIDLSDPASVPVQ